MKVVLPFTLLIAGAGLIQASIIETISLDLSPLHAGSILSGTFTLPDSPMAGDTAPALLSFSDPSDYTPTTLTSTIAILSGTPSGLAVDFSDLPFTNLSGKVTPINTRDVNLMRFAFAVCASFPCTATGLFQDRSPAVFSSTYTITPASVPEPGYVLLISTLLTAIVFGRRFVRPTKTKSPI
ncbi:MAG: hypothetical protein JO210_18085 [Acidobacteriaceae bacterium]|nr:hypothetical protein [Acidobacteriaceae bacterium]